MEFDEFTRQVGIRVQLLRNKRGWNQGDLAEAIERSTDTVYNIERGFSSTQIKTMFRIAEVLGVPLSELFDVGPPLPVDRERRKLVDHLVEMVSVEDTNTIEAVTA